MRIDFVKSIIAIGISTLLAYACYEICDYERLQWVIAIGALLTLSIPALFALGVSSNQERSSVVLKVLSWTILLVEFVSNGIFVFFDFRIPSYVIINGLIILVFMLIYYSIYQARM